MSDGPKDPPIEEQEYIVKQVIDLGSIRIARGMSRRPHRSCPHAQLKYDLQERRIWCHDCETTIEGFDAFMVLVRNFQSMTAHAEAEMREAEEAKAATLHRIAARNIEKIWRRKMAVSCPHCSRGILPTDSLGSQSPEFERARRGKA